MEGYIIRDYEIVKVSVLEEDDTMYYVGCEKFKICIKKKELFMDESECLKKLSILKESLKIEWWK